MRSLFASSVACPKLAVLALLVVSLVTTNASSTRLSAQLLGTRSSPYYYYFQGVRVQLTASTTESVVRFRNDAASVREGLLAQLGANATIVREVPSARGSLVVVSHQPFVTLVAPVAGARTSSRELLRARDDVELVAPVYHYGAAGHRLIPTDEISVRLADGLAREQLGPLIGGRGLSIVRPIWGTVDEFVLRVDDSTLDVLDVARQLYESGSFDWAEPNFVQEYRKELTPDDQFFGSQWHLNNTGQSGGQPGADVRAPSAWDVQSGSASMVIAILDDGVQRAHDDLLPNIFVNPGEVPANGLDDDGNGFSDDVNGWDFQQNDNQPDPYWFGDNHGTAVAGVAAARGFNGTGVSGVCPNCRILPVRIDLASDAGIADAIRYAASLADVLNASWGGGAPSSAIHSAIQHATITGRNGKGSVVVVAAGNDASGWGAGGAGLGRYLAPVPAGTHRFRWEYVKNGAGIGGDDTSWLTWVLFPDGQLVDFQHGMPPGFTTGGAAPWQVVTDPLHTDESLCLTRAVKAGTIGDGAVSYIEVVKALPASTDGLYYPRWVSSASGDGLRLVVDLFNDGTVDYTDILYSWPTTVESPVAYPAAHPESIAVGASSDRDCRSHYSQVGPALSLVAPSSGGALNAGILTTDWSIRFGGYSEGAYTEYFGGTSAASPMVAAAAALVLTQNPSLTAAEVRVLLESTADRIGPVPYVNGRNDRYGAGRLNIAAALRATPSAPAVAPVIVVQPRSQNIVSGASAVLTVGVTGTDPLTYQWFHRPSGDASSPVPGATAKTLLTPPLSAPQSYWVRVSNAFGSAASDTALIDNSGAEYDPQLQAPRCPAVGVACDSGRLLVGRGLAGPEPNFPNTLHGQCFEGTLGIFHYDESIDRVRVSTVGGGPFVPGATVKVEVTVWSIGLGGTPVHLFYTGDANNPAWAPIASIPVLAFGLQTVTAFHILPAGTTQAVRSGYGGNPPLCYGGFMGSYRDDDDLVFAVANPPEPPVILVPPSGVVDTSATLSVLAIGASPMTYQWYEGQSGDVSRPVIGANTAVLRTAVLATTTSYWVRLTNAFGAAASPAATILVPVKTTAVYDALFGAPACMTWAGVCDTGSPGAIYARSSWEQNSPNTIASSCTDGSNGGDESIDALKLTSLDGTRFAPGKAVRIDVLVNAFSNLYNFVDLFYAGDAASPDWVYITTLVPTESGRQTLSATYVLPPGGTQAVRARIRYRGEVGACVTQGVGAFDDYDDLVFVAGPPVVAPLQPIITSQPEDRATAPTTLRVLAIGAAPLFFQWYQGESGDTSRPVSEGNGPSVRVFPPSGAVRYWVRVSNLSGSVDSRAATVRNIFPAQAFFDATLRAPKCSTPVAACQYAITNGGAGWNEPNPPNTIYATCTDGTARKRDDESIFGLKVATLDGAPFAPGKAVSIDVSLIAYSAATNALDLYYTGTATNPSWTFIATLRPKGAGINQLSAVYVLPPGRLQAVRARLRYNGVEAPCGVSPYDDHDDLIFTTTDTSSAFSSDAPVSLLGLESFVAGSNAQPARSSASRTPVRQSPARSDEIDREPVVGTAETTILGPAAAPESAVAPIPSNELSSSDADPVVYEAPISLRLAFPLTPAGVSYAEISFTRADTGQSSSGSCTIYVNVATGAVYLVDDEGRSLLSGQVGSQSPLQNAQCKVALDALSVGSTAAGLEVSLNVAFTRTFAEAVRTYTQVLDSSGKSSGWVQRPEAFAHGAIPERSETDTR